MISWSLRLTIPRLERLEWTIHALTQRVNLLEAERAHLTSQGTDVAAYLTPAQEEHNSSRGQSRTQSEDQNAAPLFILRDATTDSGFAQFSRPSLQEFDRNTPKSPSMSPSDDIIVKGLVTPQEAYVLLGLFQEHYARWVSFDKTSATAVLLESVRKSPLLLTACCLIAVR